MALNTGSKIPKYILVVAIFAAGATISGIIINHQNGIAIREINEKTIDEINELKKNQLALVERDFKNFNPELKYRVQEIGFEQFKPNSIWYHVISYGDDDVFVKNRWSIEEQVCINNGQIQLISYDFSNRTSFKLTKSDGEQDFNMKIPDEFFINIFPEKTSFLV